MVHVDSHADLGLGCAPSDFLQSAMLTFPIESRRKIRDYEFNGKIEQINMAQSPNYTPASADFIMDIIREYIIEI